MSIETLEVKQAIFLTRQNCLHPEASDQEIVSHLKNLCGGIYTDAVNSIEQRVEILSTELEVSQAENAQLQQQVNDLQFRIDRWNRVADDYDDLEIKYNHEQVAAKVFMLERDTLNFQMILQMGRDRILWLARRLALSEERATSAVAAKDKAIADLIGLKRENKKLRARKTVY